MRPSNLCEEEGRIVPYSSSRGCLVTGCVLPFPVRSLSLFLVKSISCNLSVSKKQALSIFGDLQNRLFCLLIWNCQFAFHDDDLEQDQSISNALEMSDLSTLVISSFRHVTAIPRTASRDLATLSITPTYLHHRFTKH